MTELQYEKAKSKGIKFYLIWMKQNKLRKKKVPYKDLDDSWMKLGWTNETNVYDFVLQCQTRYVSEDKFESQAKKYLDEIKKDYMKSMKEIQRKLDKLEAALQKLEETI